MARFLNNPPGRRPPAAPAERENLVQDNLEELLALSLEGLSAMFDPGRELLFTRCFTGPATRSDYLSPRYTIMTSLGLAEARAAGARTDLDPVRLLHSGWAQHPHRQELDHMAIALWSNRLNQASLEGEILPPLLAALADPARWEKENGRVLAWVLMALTVHWEADRSPAVAAAARSVRDFALGRCWRPGGGLFANRAVGPFYYSRMGLFSTQIYWVQALATYARIFGDPEALRVAERTADTLIAARDPHGGWPWRYDALTGKVTERFPVYSVHQHGMAPMALLALAEATGRDSRAVLRESLSWLWHNQLRIAMVDPARNVIYRSIQRRPMVRRAFMYSGWAAALAGLPGPGEWALGLELNATCRPYELGWLLYAWSRNLDRIRISSPR
jgi:hypothetical protein